jgi:hypothetical protein
MCEAWGGRGHNGRVYDEDNSRRDCPNGSKRDGGGVGCASEWVGVFDRYIPDDLENVKDKKNCYQTHSSKEAICRMVKSLYVFKQIIIRSRLEIPCM